MSFAVLVLAFAGCSTLFEAISPNDTTTGYTQAKNSSGETVYLRNRYVGPTPTPTATPWAYPTPEPTPYSTPEPRPKIESSDLGSEGGSHGYVETKKVTDVKDHPLAAEDEGSKSRGPGLGLEMGVNEKHFHLNAMLLHRFGFIDGKLGFSLFKSGDDLYAGFDLGARPRFAIVEDRFSVFAGVGAYAGDTKNCTTQYNVESCEKKFLVAGYLEGGIYLWNLSLFARRYAIEEAGRRVPSDIFYGVGFHTTY